MDLGKEWKEVMAVADDEEEFDDEDQAARHPIAAGSASNG